MKKLALLVGGGPAPGINGVISSVAIEGINHGMEIIGIRDGFKWLVRGDPEHIASLSIDDVSGRHLRGGSMLGTSRTNPTVSPQDMRHTLEVLRRLGVDAL